MILCHVKTINYSYYTQVFLHLGKANIDFDNYTAIKHLCIKLREIQINVIYQDLHKLAFPQYNKTYLGITA